MENVVINFQSQLEGINKAISSLQKLQQEDRKLADEFMKTSQKAKQSTDQINSSFNSLNNSLKNIAGSIAVAFSVTALVSYGKEALSLKAKMESLQNTFNFAFGSATEGAKAMEFVRALSNKLGLELLSTADAFKKFSAASNLSGISADQTKKIFSQVSTAITAMGLSADDANGVFLALSQVISKGTVQAEELRGQIGERLPGAFELAAKSLGVTTRELNKMLEQGQVISKDFLPKFADEIERTFGAAVPAAMESTQAKLNRLSNSFTELKISIGTLVADSGIVDFFNTMSEGIKNIGKSDIDIAKQIKGQEALDIIQEIESAAKSQGKTFEEVAAITKKQTEASLEGLKAQSIELESRVDEEDISLLKKEATAIESRIHQREEELKLIQAELGIRDQQKKKNEELTDTLKNISSLKKEELEILAGQGIKAAKDELKLRETITKEEERALGQLQKIRIQNIADERERIIAQAEFEISEVKGSKETQARIIKEIQQKLNNDLADLYAKDAEAKREFDEQNAKDFERIISAKKKVREELNDDFAKSVRKQLKDSAETEVEEEEEDRKKFEEEQEFKKNASVEFGNLLFDLNSELNNRDAEEAKKLLDSKAISEEQYAEKIKQIKRKQAQTDKAQSIFNIAIHTAENLVKVFPNPVLEALAIALGVVQTAVVLARPIPFNKGTKSVPGVDRGRDEVHAILRPGEKVFPVHTSKEFSPILDAIFDHKLPSVFLNKIARGEVDGKYVIDEYSIKRGMEGALRGGVTIKNLPKNNGISFSELEFMKRRGLI